MNINKLNHKQRGRKMSLNKSLVIGRLGQDVELKYLESGMAVANFSVATTESWNDKDGKKQERTDWHNIVVWDKLAELCNQYLKKGSQCYVEGKMQTRSWDTKDGGKAYRTEVVAKTVQFLDAKGESQDDAKPAQDYKPSEQAEFKSDDIPF